MIAVLLAWLPLAFVTPGAPSTAAGSIMLTWTAPGDDSLTGTASAYDLRYDTRLISEPTFASAASVSLASPLGGGTQEGATVGGLAMGVPYWFALKAVDDAGNWSPLSNVVSLTPEPPPAAKAYRMRGRDEGGYAFDVSAHVAPGGPELTPGAPGSPGVAWLFFPPGGSFDPHGCEYALSAQLDDGIWADPFAAWHVVAGALDTTYFARGWPVTPELVDGMRFVVLEDDPREVRFCDVWTQEEEQLRMRARLCQLYGFWVLRGVRQGCP